MVNIYDYTHVQKNSYFIREGSRVVLVDINEKVIHVSKYGMRIYFIFSRYQLVYLEQNSPLYRKVLDAYHEMLGDLVLPNRYKRGDYCQN